MARTKKPKLIIRSSDIETETSKTKRFKNSGTTSNKRRESKLKKKDVILKEILEDTIQDNEVWFKVICDDVNTPIRWVKGLDLPSECIHKIDEYLEKKKSKKKRPHIHPYMLRSGKPTPPDPERVDRTKQLILNNLLSCVDDEDNVYSNKSPVLESKNSSQSKAIHSKPNVSNFEVDDGLPSWNVEVNDDFPGWETNEELLTNKIS
ncbi:6198_t:CDS:2 [Ambispora leptoticha]|uniref:6198_t:CDS:1 n=1 Tax=Ambispora leptoticha TaxID=144679 RepID=A0A9N9CI43_9GLOM|nr:6198_t:CDS:2 [Ambispora leptoticha]